MKNIVNPNLTDFEKQVLFNKSTEPPFSGQYDNHFLEGAYICKNCASLLFFSQNKFNSGCGWPSFDDEVEGAITRITDKDGKRTEIVCSNCQSHLGHVFTGENLTTKNLRHCVNSVSLNFVPIEKLQSIILGAGCFWGVEYWFKKLKGVLSVTSGYSGGNMANPSYEDVCSGQTGHYEVVQVLFDSDLVGVEKLLKYFFEIHNFEQANGQGPDIGEQYQSIIFYQDDKQRKIAQDLVYILQKLNFHPATKILASRPFYKAEEYHQNYYQKTSKYPYCHSYNKIF